MKWQDLRQSPQYGQYMQNLGWRVELGCFIKKLPLLPFSLIKVQRPDSPPNLKALKKFRPVFISYEPLVGAKPSAGFKPATPMLPSKTIWLDLTKNLSQLLDKMHPKARYNLKKHQPISGKIKIICGDKITSAQLKNFYRIYQANFRRQKFWGLNFNQLNNLVNAFGENSYLLVVRRKPIGSDPNRNSRLQAEKGSPAGEGSDPIGGLLILIHDRVAYYSHNAATAEGRRMFAPTLLTWEAIKLAKKLNCARFDFEGITDERWPLTRKWAGFTRFKKSFGGQAVTYPGNFIRWQLPF